jgi:hypothetical protein
MQNEEITSNVSLDELFGNPDLHSLDINSDEFAAAVAQTKNEQDDVDSAPITEDDSEKQEVDEDEPKKKSGLSKRIDKLTAEKRALERRLAELESTPPATEPTKQEQNVDSSRPRMDDFDSLEDFADALTEWKIDQREAQREAKQSVEKYQTEWEAKEAKVKEAYADYHDVVNIESLQRSNASQEAKVFLNDSNIGPDVIYNLVSNEDLFDEFVEANPVKQIKILTKIELALESKQAPSSTKVTSAPNPPKKLNASRPVSTGRDLIQNAGEMSDAEWLRLADEHSRSKRNKR